MGRELMVICKIMLKKYYLMHFVLRKKHGKIFQSLRLTITQRQLIKSLIFRRATVGMIFI